MRKTRTMKNDDIKKNPALEIDATPPRFLSIVEGYLMSNYPMDRGNFDPRKMEVRTSQEIVLDLAEMADMDLNDVADCMVWLGYRTIITDNKVGWLLGRVEALENGRTGEGDIWN